MEQTIAESLLTLKSALEKKSEKISASEMAYKIGVHEIPKSIKQFLAKNSPSKYWAFEGSVGKGSWSRTPWIAIYDERVTSRASDGFFVTIILTEDYKNLFLVLMNTSSKHLNYTPFKLSLSQLEPLEGFKLGAIPRGELSPSGRGTGPDFESSTLLWRKFYLETAELTQFENYLNSLTNYYKTLSVSLEKTLPKEKPFRDNSFILR